MRYAFFVFLSFLFIFSCSLQSSPPLDLPTSFEDVSASYKAQYGDPDKVYTSEWAKGKMWEWNNRLRVQFSYDEKGNWFVLFEKVYHSLDEALSPYVNKYGEGLIIGLYTPNCSYTEISYDFSVARICVTVINDEYAEIWGWWVLREDNY